MNHQLINHDGTAYVATTENGVPCDKILLVVYAEGDCDRAPAAPRNGKQRRMVVSALYDFLQYDEAGTFKDGDTITLPNGRLIARVEGVHVFPVA